MVSDTPICESKTECRNADEMRNLAGCKASKLSTVLKKEGISLFYIMTQKLGSGKEEWSKYVYSYIDKTNNGEKPGYLR